MQQNSNKHITRISEADDSLQTFIDSKFSKKLFTASISLDNTISRISYSMIDHDDMLEKEDIIRNVTNIMYKFALSHLYHTRRTRKNLLIALDQEALRNGTISLPVFYRPMASTDNSEQDDKILFESTLSAVEILLIEKDLPIVEYIHNKSISHPYTLLFDTGTPLIHYRHKSTIELTNKLEEALSALHKKEPELCIDIAIGNNLISIPSIGNSHNIHLTKPSNTPEIIDGHVFNGKQTADQTVFYVKSNGSNKEFRLFEVSNEDKVILARKAKYDDPVRLLVYPVVKYARGLTTPTDKFILNKILSSNDVGQIPMNYSSP